MALEEFNHFFQEAYPADLKKAQVEKDAIKKSGDMTIIKKIVRACTDNNGHTHLPKISKGNFNRLGVPTHIRNMNPDEYQMAYDYIKPIFDELRDPQQIHSDNFRSLKKKLFDLTGIGRPESHVITIVDKPLPGSVSFNIIQKKQNSLYKRTNKTKFVHFSNANNLSTLRPTGSSKVFNGHRYLYPNFRCYLWAIEGESIPGYMIDYAREVYGKHIYQYTPKTSDKIVIDMSESKRFPGCTPVFIETDKPLSVKDITNDIDIDNTNVVNYNVDNDTKGTTTSDKQSIIQDENRKVLKEFKSIEYAVMHVLNNFIHMKESTKNATKYRKLYNKIEENIEFDSDLITSEKAKCVENYPNAKNISLFDDLLKRYTKKVNAVLTELENLIKKSNVVKESYGPEEDHTTGTSEFDEPHNDDPDDCYCEQSIFDDEDTDTEYDWLASKLDNEVAFWLGKCYNLWTSVPDVVYSSDSFGVDIIDYLPDDWEFAVTTPDIWKDLIDQTIRCSNAILYTIDEFDKLDPEQKMKHEGVKFDHNELIENINQIIQLANNVKSSSIFNILDSQHVMSAEEKSQVNDVYEVGHLFKAIAKDWVSKYKPNRLRYFQEAYDAITGKEIPIDHAYTMDEMKERTYTDDELDKIQSKEELDSFYTELKSKLGQDETIQEAKLPSKKRNKLPDSDFALVYTDANGKKIRKYPIHDEAHCRAAAHMFPRGVPLKYKATVARKILRRAHKFGIDTSGWKNLNNFTKRSDK